MTSNASDFQADLHIRDADAADAAELSAFAATLFRDTYTTTTRAADLDSYIAEHFRPEIRAAEIAAVEYRTLLLHLEGELAGYAQMRRGPAPSCVLPTAARRDAIEIQRFYVAPKWRGRGVAQGFMTGCLRRAPAGTTVWLGVFTSNARAIAFYTKCGYRVVGDTTFQMGDDSQRDHIMQWSGALHSSDRPTDRVAANDTSR